MFCSSLEHRWMAMGRLLAFESVVAHRSTGNLPLSTERAALGRRKLHSNDGTEFAPARGFTNE
jgi:hypothetical protein